MRAKNKEKHKRPHIIGVHLGLEFSVILNCYLERRLIRPITRLVPLSGRTAAWVGHHMLEVRAG